MHILSVQQNQVALSQELILRSFHLNGHTLSLGCHLQTEKS